MKSVAVGLLVLVVIAALGLFIYFETPVLQEQRLSARLDLQKKCAQEAQDVFNSSGLNRLNSSDAPPDSKASFTDHYNEKLDKCFVEIKSYFAPSLDDQTDAFLAEDHALLAEDPFRPGPAQTQKFFDTGAWQTTVYDAFERKNYAVYSWKAMYEWNNDATKKYSDVDTKCTVTLPSGETTICHSSKEFDALVQLYME
ncbi:MAG: hypothetical protein WBR29_04365 [Gammaproteobacteria bacterium]